MITDKQILAILDLTTHCPTGGEYPRNQREGLDIFLGTNEELIDKVRQILAESRPAFDHIDELLTEDVKSRGKQ